MPNVEALSKELKATREMLKLTQDELSVKIDLSQALISKMETGKVKDMRVKTADKIARFLQAVQEQQSVVTS